MDSNQRIGQKAYTTARGIVLGLRPDLFTDPGPTVEYKEKAAVQDYWIQSVRIQLLEFLIDNQR